MKRTSVLEYDKMCLILISPAPVDIKRPRLSCPVEESENIVIAETPSPKPRIPEANSELRSIADE